jgi:hypothetical protein
MDMKILDSIKSKSREELANISKNIKSFGKLENVQINNKLIKISPVPLVFQKEHSNKLNKKLEKINSIIIKIERFARSNNGKTIKDRLFNSLSTGGKKLFLQSDYESDYSLERRFLRYDGFFNPETEDYKIIEINQAAPLALSFYETGMNASEEIYSEFGLTHEDGISKLLDWFLDEFKQRFPNRKLKNIAVPIEHGYPPKFSDIKNICNKLNKISKERYNGETKFHLCFPYELGLKEEDIHYNKIKIDMIWRNTVYLKYYQDKNIDVSDYETILSNPKKFLTINSPRVWLTRSKELFSIIWNDSLIKDVGLSDKEISEIRELIPLTLNLHQEKNFLEKVINEKDKWISKPCDSGFGEGVIFGSDTSQEKWQKIVLERSSTEGYVFQMKVDYPKIRFLDIDEKGNPLEKDLFFDFCPYRINGTFSDNFLVRGIWNSEGIKKMNLTEEGMLIPCFFV